MPSAPRCHRGSVELVGCGQLVKVWHAHRPAVTPGLVSPQSAPIATTAAASLRRPTNHQAPRIPQGVCGKLSMTSAAGSNN
jgi:hypothetical protein